MTARAQASQRFRLNLSRHGTLAGRNRQKLTLLESCRIGRYRVVVTRAGAKDVFNDTQSGGDIQTPVRDTDPTFTVHAVEKAGPTLSAESAFCRMGRDIPLKTGILRESQIVERGVRRHNMHQQPPQPPFSPMSAS